MGVFRDAMDEAMVLRGLAPRTRKTYLHWVGRLVRFCRVTPDRLTTTEVRAFLLYLTQERKVSFRRSTRRSTRCVSSLPPC
jgi:hypothetical protein